MEAIVLGAKYAVRAVGPGLQGRGETSATPQINARRLVGFARGASKVGFCLVLAKTEPPVFDQVSS